MIVLVSRSQRRKVLSLMIPELGYKIESGTRKSEVIMMFLSKLTVRPWGLKLSARMLALPATSSGNSPMML